MTILVTGGAGFIGSRLVRALLDRGEQVIVVDDLSGGGAEAVPDGADLQVLDVSDQRAARAIAAHRPATVIHCAAMISVPRSVAEPDRDRAVNVDGTRHVVRGAGEAGAGRIVFLSSGGAVYGDTERATERSPVRPLSPYGRHKREAELIVAGSGLPYAVARLSNVYGPGQRSDLEGGVVAIFAGRLSSGEPLEIHGNGDQVRDFLYVDDAVAAVVALASSPRSGTWNVSTGIGTSIRTLQTEMEELFGPATAVRRLPRRSGDVRSSILAADLITRDIGWASAYDLRAGLAALRDELDASGR